MSPLLPTPSFLQAASAGPPGRYASGVHVGVPMDNIGFSNVTPTQSALFACPLLIYGTTAVAFSSVAVDCNATAASSSLRIGFYAVGSNGGPGALLYDLGTVDTSSSTGILTISSSFTLGPGWVYIAMVAQGGSAQFKSCQPYAGGPAVDGIDRVTSSSLAVSSESPFLEAVAACTGALPNPFGSFQHPVDVGAIPRWDMICT